jgi:hypothetical protein
MRLSTRSVRAVAVPLAALALAVAALSSCSRGPRPVPALAEAEREDICEAAFKRLATSGMFAAGAESVLFLAMPGGADPSGAFMARCRSRLPGAEKASMAYRTGDAARQVRHRVTDRPGWLLRVSEPVRLDAGRVRVEAGYDGWSLGAGSCTYVLVRRGGRWEIAEERRGPQA